METSFVFGVIFGLALAVLLWIMRRPAQQQSAVSDGTALKKRRTAVPTTFAPVKTVKVAVEGRRAGKPGGSCRCMFRVDSSRRQTCQRCRAEFYGDRIRSEKCPRCGNALATWTLVVSPWMSTHIVVSEECVARLFRELCDRLVIRG